ncbi:MAG: lipid-A-disaccharide synthase [Gemmatimonadota bacterium]|nr:lipid-A-disaccharide synthase [Gemmatimonadota bacterium]
MAREVLFVAGETSGDLHAAGVAAALRRRAPAIPLAGVGGASMEAAGVSLLEHTDRLAAMGLVELIRHVPRHYALLDRISQRLRRGTVGLVVLVDYPGFNLKVAAAARRADVPVLYYITPQVWAWGAGRVATLARLVTRAAVILPFEERVLRAAGVDATFVGHPLLDRLDSLPSRAAARQQLGIAAGDRVLALFPGSRPEEIARHLDPFVATAREAERRSPGLRIVVSVAPGLELDPARCPYPMARGASFAVLRAADAALCKSGTTTLEAAVAGCPLVIAYRTSALTYAVARRVVKVRHIGLVNVVAEREVAREFVQSAVVPARMADALAPLLEHGSPERRELVQALADVRAKLGTAGAADRVAGLAIELVQ